MIAFVAAALFAQTKRAITAGAAFLAAADSPAPMFGCAGPEACLYICARAYYIRAKLARGKIELVAVVKMSGLKNSTFAVPANVMRLDTRVTLETPALSRKQARRLIREHRVLVNGMPAHGRVLVSHGDKIEINAPPPLPPVIEPRAIELEVIHEDADLIVLNKPAGLPMHPVGNRFSLTLANALLHRCPDMIIANERRAGLVHRLDRDTSGVVVAAKNSRSLAILARQFQRRRVLKEYLAVIVGRIEPSSGKIDAPLAPDPLRAGRMTASEKGKQALTHYETIERLADIALLRVRIETGVTHQIRAHMAHLGHPLLGDWRYGASVAGQSRAHAFRQMLHARRLVIRHPATNEFVEYVAPMPDDFRTVLETAQFSMRGNQQ